MTSFFAVMTLFLNVSLTSALIFDAPLTNTITGFKSAQAVGEQVDLSTTPSGIPGRLEIGVAPDGSSALLSQIFDGDPVTFTGIRAELSASPDTGECWYVWEMFVPTDFGTTGLFSLMQIHDVPDSGENPVKFPNFGLATQNGRVKGFLPTNTPAELRAYRNVGDVALITGRWVKCWLRANWATDNTGFIEVGYDGITLVKEWLRPSAYYDAVGPYWKLGLYDYFHNAGAFGSRRAWYRNAKCYSGSHSYSEVLGFIPQPSRHLGETAIK
jgi:hypothetical protein